MAANATDGSLNVTVVDGSSLVGARAADGSINVVQVTGSTYTGRKHRSGATNVVVSAVGGKMNHACGALCVSVSPYVKGNQPVTVVGGAFA